ncbi:Plasmodium exported protein (Pm-fam-a like), unknown function [Plasmodium malariae]|uniref:Fam-m protein n=1 Tax=Plasmodium malariae TaxID=5858 RepID=A0A1A8X6D0_PLAMA|nr:Plasmodium exported protein (Pm-fam-a like), unknown function [Plasmodium malariae]
MDIRFLHKKLDTRKYRLLAKYKLNSHSNNVCLKEISENNESNKQRNLSNNERWIKEKNKQSSRNLLNKAQYYTEVIDYDNGMFDGKHFHFKKKWVKKKDLDIFFAKKKRIGDIGLKKIKFRNYGFGVALFFIFFLLGIGIPSLYGINSLNIKWENIGSSEFWKHFKGPIESIVPKSIAPYMHIISFIILIVIISIILIVVIYKILRNNEKYQKIKLMME